VSKYLIFMMCAGGRPEAPGVRGPRAASCATWDHKRRYSSPACADLICWGGNWN